MFICFCCTHFLFVFLQFVVLPMDRWLCYIHEPRSFPAISEFFGLWIARTAGRKPLVSNDLPTLSCTSRLRSFNWLIDWFFNWDIDQCIDWLIVRLIEFDFGSVCLYIGSLPSGVNKLGVWKLEPHFHSDTSPVVIYIHGAQGSRAAYHRIQMYRLLLKIGSPVVTFDYRGYGDSTGIPTSELDLLQDTMVVYRWTREQFPDRPLLLWAHSLGNQLVDVYSTVRSIQLWNVLNLNFRFISFSSTLNLNFFSSV